MGLKGNTKRAFGDSSDSESESEEDKFGQYVKRKAVEANKRVQNAKKFEFDVESETEKPSKEQPAKSRFIGNILESRKPVSYTHLDVYKRQIYNQMETSTPFLSTEE